MLLVGIALTFLATFLLQLIDATAIDPPLPTVQKALSDGSGTALRASY